MAIPGQPTTLSVVADAMNQAIHTLNATSTSPVVLNNAASFLENVKVQLWASSTTDKLLETTAIVLTAAGSSAVTLPADFDHETEVRVYDGPEDTHRGTLQAATSTAVQLASTFSQDPDSLLGSWVFTLSGMGAGQGGQIATYSETTKWASLDSTFSTVPTSTTTYVVATHWWPLTKVDQPRGFQFNGPPTIYRMVATTTYVQPPSDQIYPARIFYGANLMRLDDSSFTFTNHLRQRRYYWLQGLKVETMAQFDDDRYETELGKWQVVLANYAGKNPIYTRTSFVR